MIMLSMNGVFEIFCSCVALSVINARAYLPTVCLQVSIKLMALSVTALVAVLALVPHTLGAAADVAAALLVKLTMIPAMMHWSKE